MKAILLFSINRVFDGKKGESFRLFMDLYKVPSASSDVFDLTLYKLSWIFFNSEEPDRRVLMDNHKPIGLHLHINQGPQIPVTAMTIEEAKKIFVENIKKHFDFDLEV